MVDPLLNIVARGLRQLLPPGRRYGAEIRNTPRLLRAGVTLNMT
jgi:hypothetical protein